jgi:hypothetical protein
VTTTNDTKCLLDWCDTNAHTGGLCRHHANLEARAATYAKRELYAALAAYYEDDTGWHDAKPIEPTPNVITQIRPVPSTWTHPDGTDYGLATLRGMVGDLAGLAGDGRSDALMRMAYRAGRLVAEGQLNETLVIRVVEDCISALYPRSEGGKRYRAHRRAMDSIADGIRKQAVA